MNHTNTSGSMPGEIHHDNMHLTITHRYCIPKDQSLALEKEKIAARLLCIFQKYQSHDL